MLFDFLKKKFLAFIIMITLIVGVISAVNNIWFNDKTEKVNMISDATGIVISPVQGAFTWVLGNIGDIFNYFGTNQKSNEENAVLKKHVVELERQLLEMGTYKDENNRLRELLDLKLRNNNYETVGAEIISRDINNWSGILKIDKGTINGISKNDVVIENTGLVGYVTDVGTTWANITTIVAPGSNVSCILPRTGEIVMIEGSVSDNRNGTCTMSYIPSESTIAVGEAVETSGEGGIFPKGIFIGRVEKLSTGKNGISKEAVIRPTVNFKILREVLVIKMSE